jgi:alkylhydroperoxidase family enzyme
MPFIETIPDAEISDEVRAMYERQQSFWGFVPNYAKLFGWRPELMGLWAQLQTGIKRHMDKRRFELVTFAAAATLRSTLCSLAHGRTLTTWFSMEDVQLMARGASPASLTDAEAAMMAFARKAARGAFLVTAADVDELRKHGFSDAEMFDISAAVGARAFWTTLIESLGVEPEPPLLELEPEFRKTLTVGRPPRSGDSPHFPANGDSPTSPASV